MIIKVMQQIIKIWKEQKSNLRVQFENQQKEILEQIEPNDVNITGLYDEWLQELQDN